MRSFYLSLTFAFATLATASAFAQHNATITVSETGSGTPVVNATVVLGGNSVTTDPAGQAVFQGLADNTYDYSVTAACHNPGSGAVTVEDADAVSSVSLNMATTNRLLFYVGSPFVVLGATVHVTNTSGYDETFETTDTFGGDGLDSVPYGEVTYTITKPCYATVTGTATVDCNNGGAILVFENFHLATTNRMLFYVGSPFVVLGATVHVTNTSGYNETFETTDTFGGDGLDSVPYGEVTYTITKPCYATVTGTATVDCNNGGAILVFENFHLATTNRLLFYVGNPFVILGATVHVTNASGYDETFETTDTFGGDGLDSVPYGEVTYTITKPCYATVTGTATVDCNNGGAILVFENFHLATTNRLLFYVGDPFILLGATVHVTNVSGLDTTFMTTDTFGGDGLDSVPYGEVNYTISKPCYVTVTGTATVDCKNGGAILVFEDPTAIVIDASVTLSGATLTATGIGMDYQWVDCDNNNEPIDGATAQSFEPAESGNYAVVITNGNCSETSTCTSVVVTGVKDLAGRDAFSVYPNPFNNMLTVRTDGTLGPVHVELLSLSGQVITDETSSGMEITLQTANLPSGSYLLRLSSKNARTTLGVIK